MTRISSLFVAATVAILPMGAFAQQSTATMKAAAPTAITTAAPATTAPVTGKTATTATVAQPAKPDAKTPTVAAKSQVHGLNTVTSPHAKAAVPTKS
jgi:hypothetical protein